MLENYKKHVVKKQQPRPKKDVNKIALCAIAKNENLYIREWVEHHKNIGITHIFLYDNNDINGERFEEVINDYIKSGFVEIIDRRGVEKGCVYDKRGINLQTLCYIDCYENKCKDYDWLCLFDIDEFLEMKGKTTLQQFLNNKKFDYCDTILIPWVLYGDNDNIRYENKPVQERFTKPIPKERVGVKSIVRCNYGISYKDKSVPNMIHCFVVGNRRICYSTGESTLPSLTNNWKSMYYQFVYVSMAYLKHYKTKSTEEYLTRHLGRHWGTSRKYTDKAKTINMCMDEYFKFNKKTDEKISFFKNYENMIKTNTKILL